MLALIPIITTAVKVAQTVYKHRKAIYAVVTAQDRYISKSFKYGGYGKATSWGVRSGALAGSLLGQFINNAPDTPGNGVQKPINVPTPSAPYKARGGSTRRSSYRYSERQRPYRSKRCACPSKRKRSRNWF